MRVSARREAGGQTLVQLALMMTVLLAFVALAVDFGHVYQERRRLQNAADAGALAAARTRCFGGLNGDFGTVADAIAAGDMYASSLDFNGAPQAQTTTADGWTYTVTTTMQAETFFASVVGLDTVTVHALAAAKCGGATSGCGLWPVGLSVDQWNNLYDKSCAPGGKPISFYVWASYHGGSGCGNPNDPTCCVDPTDPTCTGVCEDMNCKDPQCGYLYNCDTDNDGIEDVFTEQGRAWLDFTGYEDPNFNAPFSCPDNGCGTSELGDCILGSPNVRINLPACIGGDVGVKGGAKQEVVERKGDIVGLPIYDPDVAECTPPGGNNCDQNTYWVVKFGCIEIDKNQPWRRLSLDKLPTAPPGTPNKWHGWTIMVTVACGGCNTNCGGTGEPAPPPEPGGMRAVSLIK